jgi:hypothetical protein
LTQKSAGEEQEKEESLHLRSRLRKLGGSCQQEFERFGRRGIRIFQHNT